MNEEVISLHPGAFVRELVEQLSSGEIMIAPVSVCHQVSTIGVLSAPNAIRYQRHASVLPAPLGFQTAMLLG